MTGKGMNAGRMKSWDHFLPIYHGLGQVRFPLEASVPAFFVGLYLSVGLLEHSTT